MGAQDVGILVHEIAHDLGDTTAAAYAAEVERRWGRLGLPPGWLSRRRLAEATRMTDRLARYVDETTAEGWRRAASEQKLRLALGRAVVSGTVDRVEVDPSGRVRVVDLKTGSSKPTRDEVRRHGQLGAYQLAVAEGAFAEHGTGSGGRRPAPAGEGGQRRDDGPGAGAPRRRRGARLGSGPARPDRRRDVGCRLRRHARVALRAVPAQGVLSRAVRGEVPVTALTGVRWGAVDLARALGRSSVPTPEQVAVIEAPLRPLLVVAGAGSGKTETMAARVVWLVANDLVRPDEVLGLTFTRKAAGELSERVVARLGALRDAGLWAPTSDDGAAVLDDVPTVSTYHAYAGRIVREHGARLGIEAESRLLTEAAAWQVAHEAVASWDGPMEGVEKAESTVTTAVVDLAGELAEHLVGAGELGEHLDEVVATLELVARGDASRRKAYPAAVRGALTVLRERRAIVPLLERYTELKRSRDAMDFADQMALAARLATVGVARWAGPSAAASGPSSSTSSRTPPRRSSSCCGRCSSPTATRSPSRRSATRTSRSTAGGGRRPRPSTGSAPTSPTPSPPRSCTCRRAGATTGSCWMPPTSSPRPSPPRRGSR